MDDRDEFARLRAEADQARRGMQDFATQTWAYYSGLVDAGFTESQAIRLTGQWLVGMMQGVAGRGDEES